MKSGDRIQTLAGTILEAPYAAEHPCFGQRQGWCKNLATWRVEGSHLILHFCDQCKAKKKFDGQDWHWEQLPVRPSN